MGWETDQPPLSYLERRVKYYKKKIATAKKWTTMDFFLRQYGKKEITRISNRRIAHYETRIGEFQKAIEVLKNHK
jgi:hypothetical protein